MAVSGEAESGSSAPTYRPESTSVSCVIQVSSPSVPIGPLECEASDATGVGEGSGQC